MEKQRFSKRGRLVARTRKCKLQATNVRLTPSLPIPFAPARPLASRVGIYIKYFFPPDQSGWFWIRGDSKPGDFAIENDGAATAYPIYAKTGEDPPTKENRRRKQIFLPLTGKVPLYALQRGNDELISTLEFE